MNQKVFPFLAGRAMLPDSVKIVALCADIQENSLAVSVGKWAVLLRQVFNQSRNVLALNLGALLNHALDKLGPPVFVHSLLLDGAKIMTTHARVVHDDLSLGLLCLSGGKSRDGGAKSYRDPK